MTNQVRNRDGNKLKFNYSTKVIGDSIGFEFGINKVAFQGLIIIFASDLY